MVASHIPSCVAGVPIFRALSPTEMEELAGSLGHRHYDRGELVAMAGDSVEQLMVVAKGRLKLVHSTASGKEQVVRILEPGDFLGEMALFTPTQYEGDLVSVEATDVCMVPRRSVQTILQNQTEVAFKMVEALAARLSAAEQLVADLGMRDVGQRLAAELLRASASEVSGPGGIRVRMPVPWTEVASRLGTTPESLSRRLRALVEEGILRQDGTRTVIIVDAQRLRELAKG